MEAKLKLPKGVENKTGKEGYLPNGNFTYTDPLNGEQLDYRWVALRGPREAFITNDKNGVYLTPFATNIKQVAPTATLFHRQQHNHFKASVQLSYLPKSDKDLAGLTCYQSERFHYVFGITKKGSQYYIVLERTEKGASTLLASQEIDLTLPITLQVAAQGNDYAFSYSTDGKPFVNVGGTVSGDVLSTNVAGGFTGSMIGLYATTNNDITIP